MTRQRGNLVLVAAVAAGLAALHSWGPRGLYTFGGHGQTLRLISEGLLWLLCATHLALAGIMWSQRRRWDAAQASIFRFVAAKALLWGFYALTGRSAPGISLSNTYLLIALLLTSADLDIQLVRRYLFARFDDATDIRLGDAPGTAGAARMQAHGEAEGVMKTKGGGQ